MTTDCIHIYNDSCQYNTTSCFSKTTSAWYNTSVTDSETKALREATNWLWRLLSPLLFVVGVSGNLGITLILWKIKFWKKQTYCFLFILAVINTVVLCVGLSRYWILAVFDIDIRDLNNAGCVIHLFLIYFSMHTSSWTMVCVTLDRFVKTKYPFRYLARYFSRKMLCFYIFTIALCLATDLHFFFTNALVKSGDKYICNNTSFQYYVFEEHYFVFIDLAMLSFIPSTLMFMMNISIGKSLQVQLAFRRLSISQPESRRRANRNSKKLTKMLFYSSIYFVATTLPISIFFAVHSFLIETASEKQSAELDLAKAVLYLVQFTNYSVNFYIYVEANVTFRKHLPSRRKRRKRLREPSSFSHHSSSLQSQKTDGDWISDAMSRNDSVASGDNRTEVDCDKYTSSNGHVPHKNLLELSATCHTIQDLEIQSENLGTFQTIPELGMHNVSCLSDSSQTISDVPTHHVHFSELSETCQTIPDLPQSETSFTYQSIHKIQHNDTSRECSVSNIGKHSILRFPDISVTIKTIQEETEDDE